VAAKRRSGASNTGSGSPGWLWLLSGTALGAVIAVALYFHDQPRPDHPVEDSAQRTPAATDSGSQPADAERHFGDIFERLDSSKPKAVTAPNTQPAAPLAASTAPAAPASTIAAPAITPPPLASKPPPPPKKSTPSSPSWWLQAGAFRSAGQADSLKARLTLTGLPVKVVSGRGGNNILWYRVRVGPYDSKQATSGARQRLQQQKISPVLIAQ
jgi:cell division protein FtsN